MDGINLDGFLNYMKKILFLSKSIILTLTPILMKKEIEKYKLFTDFIGAIINHATTHHHPPPPTTTHHHPKYTHHHP